MCLFRSASHFDDICVANTLELDSHWIVITFRVLTQKIENVYKDT